MPEAQDHLLWMQARGPYEGSMSEQGRLGEGNQLEGDSIEQGIQEAIVLERSPDHSGN
jgi:hypothetical protein